MPIDDSLPDPLPTEPLQLAATWLAEAWGRRDQPNPNAMVLATCDALGRPSARVVLCKQIEADAVRFVSNYASRKGQELQANPRAELVLHWDHLHRQVRIGGIVHRASTEESDRYFASRARDSQLGTYASDQSQPIASRTALRAKLDAVIAQFGAATVPRPAHWGGYVLWAESVELWIEGKARLHDRARWTRALSFDSSAQPHFGPWTATRLQP
jgi:pyridoxamine 5'-phosphate oxidase